MRQEQLARHEKRDARTQGVLQPLLAPSEHLDRELIGDPDEWNADRRLRRVDHPLGPWRWGLRERLRHGRGRRLRGGPGGDGGRRRRNRLAAGHPGHGGWPDGSQGRRRRGRRDGNDRRRARRSKLGRRRYWWLWSRRRRSDRLGHGSRGIRRHGQTRRPGNRGRFDAALDQGRSRFGAWRSERRQERAQAGEHQRRRRQLEQRDRRRTPEGEGDRGAVVEEVGDHEERAGRRDEQAVQPAHRGYSADRGREHEWAHADQRDEHVEDRRDHQCRKHQRR